MADEQNIPRVVFIGLASCFGCQINITNAEAHLMDILGQIDMQYWQLTSSEPMPEEFDVAVVEGAPTTSEAVELLQRVREVADKVITIGACANTAGIPGMATADYASKRSHVYGDDVPSIISAIAQEPRSVRDVIDVDFEVMCCPVDPYEFVRVLQKALYGGNEYVRTSTLCGECKRNERGCFYGRNTLCLGMVTRSGCGAKCPNLGRPCNGCAGLSPNANLEAARRVADKSGVSVQRFDDALEMFNKIKLSAEQEDHV